MFPILLGKNNDLEKRVKTLEDSGGGSSGGGVLVVTDNNGTLNKTWKEIYDAEFAVIKSIGNDGVIECRVLGYVGPYETGDYVLDAYVGNSSKVYISDSQNGYPVLSE